MHFEAKGSHLHYTGWCISPFLIPNSFSSIKFQAQELAKEEKIQTTEKKIKKVAQKMCKEHYDDTIKR